MMKSMQVLKTFKGYAVTYHDDYKQNKFVITQWGKVVAKYGDFLSCMRYIESVIGNFERIKF